MLESIRELRRRKNFTLRQLSEKTGYTVSFLSQLERGIKNPSLRRRRRERLLRAAAGRPAHNAH